MQSRPSILTPLPSIAEYKKMQYSWNPPWLAQRERKHEQWENLHFGEGLKSRQVPAFRVGRRLSHVDAKPIPEGPRGKEAS
jgi:hypothetical protein